MIVNNKTFVCKTISLALNIDKWSFRSSAKKKINANPFMRKKEKFRFCFFFINKKVEFSSKKNKNSENYLQ